MEKEKDETTRETIVIPKGYTPEEYLDVKQERPQEEPESVTEVRIVYAEE